MNLPLILASSSPSRKTILAKLGLPFKTIVPNIDETVQPGETVENHVQRLAREKALAGAAFAPEALIIGCDSVCVLNGMIMSKPETHVNAVLQLKAASGQVVYFYSGLALYNTVSQRMQHTLVRIEVHFKALTVPLIEAYLARDQPYQCAGSIKAEGLGILLLEKIIAHDPNSLVGLPLIELIRFLEQEGYQFLG